MQALTIEERLERILEQIGRSSKLSGNPKAQIERDSGIIKGLPVDQEELCDQSTAFSDHSDWDSWSDRW